MWQIQNYTVERIMYNCSCIICGKLNSGRQSKLITLMKLKISSSHPSNSIPQIKPHAPKDIAMQITFSIGSMYRYHDTTSNVVSYMQLGPREFLLCLMTVVNGMVTLQTERMPITE